MLSETRTVDSPWHRLPWTLPAALLIWAAALWGLASFMEGSANRTMAPPPLNADLMELPPPAPAMRPAPVHKPKPLPQATPEQAPKAPPVSPPTEQAPAPKTEGTTGIGPSVLTAAPGVGGGTPGEGMPAGSGSGSGGSAARGGPYGGKGTSRFGAAYLNNPRLVYPPAARKMGIEGMVMLKVLVSRGGEVLKIEVSESSGHEILDKAALEAVKNWRFVPVRQGESPMDEWVQVPVAFHLKK